MNQHWGCTLIYRLLSYPFRSLMKGKVYLPFQTVIINVTRLTLQQKVKLLTLV